MTYACVMPKKCNVDDCDQAAYAKNMCRRHYERSLRAGKGMRAYSPGLLCSVHECAFPAKAKGLCNTHYMRWRRGASLDAPIAERGLESCKFDGCSKPVHGRGLCTGHYWQWKHGMDLRPIRERVSSGGYCQAADCDRAAASSGLCTTHYDRKRRGEEEWDRPIREKAANGTGWVTPDGYRIIYVDGRRVLEHVAMFEQVYRPLVKGVENVHHCNGNRLDNRVDGPPVLRADGKLRTGNLELWSSAQPAGQEIGPKVEWARAMLALYGTDEERRRYADHSPA